MDREEALRLLRGGEEVVAEWNRWREKEEKIPDLRGAVLRGARLIEADLRGARLIEADLRGAVLSGAVLTKAKCDHTLFGNVDLSEVLQIRAITKPDSSRIIITFPFSLTRPAGSPPLTPLAPWINPARQLSGATPELNAASPVPSAVTPGG
jgi:hypothetical protein